MPSTPKAHALGCIAHAHAHATTRPAPVPRSQEVYAAQREARVLYSTGDFETLSLEETARDMHMVGQGVATGWWVGGWLGGCVGVCVGGSGE